MLNCNTIIHWYHRNIYILIIYDAKNKNKQIIVVITIRYNIPYYDMFTFNMWLGFINLPIIFQKFGRLYPIKSMVKLLFWIARYEHRYAENATYCNILHLSGDKVPNFLFFLAYRSHD
jgi:hypothetical protein